MMKVGTVFFVVVFLIIPFHLKSQDLSGLQLIAHYPLDNDSSDVTGNYPPMKLINTPFQEGGIYCNGIYVYGNQPGGSDAITPQIDGLNFKKFAIQAKFKVTKYKLQPVFIAGDIYRWLGFYLDSDSTVLALYNDNLHDSNIKYTLNTWHEITVTYDSTSDLGKWYLDGQLVDSLQFQIVHGNDKKISVTHYGTGETFEGYFDDLRIYSVGTLTAVTSRTSETPEGFQLQQNYPNPFNPSTTIRFTLSHTTHVELKVFNILGQVVAILIDEILPAGEHRVVFNAKDQNSGLYIYQLRAGNRIQQKKMLYLR